MSLPRTALTWLPFFVAVALAGLWPVTAYAATPVLLPAVLAVAVAAVVVLVRPEVGIALVLAFAGWTNLVVAGSPGSGFSPAAKPLQLLLPALAFGTLIYGLLVARGEIVSRRTAAVVAAVLVFSASAIASSLQALDPAGSIRKLVLLLTAVATFFAVRLVCRELRQLLVVVGGALTGLLLASAQGVLEHYSGSSERFGFVVAGSVVGRIQGAFGHPNQYAGFLAVLLPVAVAVVATRAMPTRLRGLAFAALALAVPALVLSYTRGAIIALVLGSLIWLAVLRPRLAALVALVCVVSGVLLAPATLRERLDPENTEGEITLRTDIWNAALTIASDHPVLGVGVDNFGRAYSSLPTVFADASQRRLLHQSELVIPPHAQNLYLNVLAEQGLIGLAALIALGVAALGVVVRGSRVADPRGRAIALGIGAGVMTFALHNVLEVTLLSEVALPLFALLAVAVSLVALDEPASASPDSHRASP